MRATGWFRNFKEVQSLVNKMKEFTVMDNFEDQSKSVVLTWGKLKKTWIIFI